MKLRLLVCYLPGLDQRRVSPELTPFTAEALNKYGSVEMDTLPSSELLPTLVTGVYPDQNKIWQVRYRTVPPATGMQRLYEAAPDWATSTLGCFRHLYDRSYDLAAIPWRRRRRFELCRFKYTSRRSAGEIPEEIGGVPSLLGLLPGESRYKFYKTHRPLLQDLGDVGTGRFRLELLELHGLDLFSHWNLDRPEAMASMLRATDVLIEALWKRCTTYGVTFLLLVDHGQERVRGSVDLVRELKKTKIDPNDYTYFIEVASARFWFHTEISRQAVLEQLRAVPRVTVLGRESLKKYNVSFEDPSFGEYYAFTDPGTIFFPHDFYHPLANMFMGLTHPWLFRRLTNPRHRGSHGHLPTHPCEKGLLAAFSSETRPIQSTMELIDFAPTALALLGAPKPSHMAGVPVLTSNGTL